MQCPKCGSALGAGAAFCPTCGSNLSPPGQPAFIPGAPQMMVAQRTSGMAIAGLVCAFFCSLLGLVFSLIGLSEIKKSNGAVGGKGIAIAGLVLSVIHIVALIAVVLFVFAFASQGVHELENKMKQTEAALQLDRISREAKVYQVENGQLPAVYASPTPSRACCSFPDHECPAKSSDWQTPAWQTLGFSIDDAHYYQYSVHSDGKTLDAEAIGNLDCGGEPSTFTLHMAVDASGNVTSHVNLP